MKAYEDQLTRLCHAILPRGDAASAIGDIRPARADAISPAERLAIYAEGYTARLRRTVLADYPALMQHMGREAMEAAVLGYILSTVSRDWDLNRYPAGFAGYLRAQKADPAACDLAALESTISEVFWLPDSEALDPASLAGVTLEELAALRFVPRTASRLLALKHAAHAWLIAFRRGEEPGPLHHEPEYLCIVRHCNEVRRLPLEPMEHALLARLYDGQPLGKALTEMEADQEALAAALPGYMSRWLGEGVFMVPARGIEPPT